MDSEFQMLCNIFFPSVAFRTNQDIIRLKSNEKVTVLHRIISSNIFIGIKTIQTQMYFQVHAKNAFND